MIDAAAKQFGMGAITVVPWVTFWAAFSAGYSNDANFFLPTYLCGEVKHAAKTIPLGLTLMIFIFTLPLILLIVLFSNAFGYSFITAMEYLWNGGSSTYPFQAQPTFNMFFAMVYHNPIVLFIINSGLIASAYAWLSVSFLQPSRFVFALSFDRLLPKWVADVNDTYHSPIKSLSLILVLAIAMAGIYSYFGVYVSVLGGGAIYALAYIILGITAICYPYVKREQYQARVLPRFRRNIGGIPLLTLAGIWFVIVAIIMIIMFVAPTFSVPGLTQVFGMFGYWGTACVFLGLALWFVPYYYRKSQGLDLGSLYAEIPPE